MQMNLYSYAAAYSLFPRSTFDFRHSFMCRDDHLAIDLPFGKGFEEDDLDELVKPCDFSARPKIDCSQLLESTATQRAIGDTACWVIRFPDTLDVVKQAFLESSTDLEAGIPYVTDTLQMNSFSMMWSSHSVMTPPEFIIFDWRGLASDPASAQSEEICVTVCEELLMKLGCIFAWSKKSRTRDLKVWTSMAWKKALARWCSVSLGQCKCIGA